MKSSSFAAAALPAPSPSISELLTPLTTERQPVASEAEVEVDDDDDDDVGVEVLPESFTKIEGPFPRDWSCAKRLRFLSVRPLRVQGLPPKQLEAAVESSATSPWLSLDSQLGFYVHPCCAGVVASSNQQQANKEQQLREWTTAFRNVVSNVLHGHCDYFYCINKTSVLLLHANHAATGHQLVFGPTKKAFRQTLDDSGIAYQMRLPDGSLEQPCSLRPVELVLSPDVVDDLRALRSVPGQAVALESHKVVAQTPANKTKFIAVGESAHIEGFLKLFLAEHTRTMIDRPTSAPLARILAPRPFLNCVLRGLHYEQGVVVRSGEKKTQEAQLLVIEGMTSVPLLPSVVEAIVRMICQQNPNELIEGRVLYSESEKKDVTSLLRHEPLLHFAIDSGAVWREPSKS